MGAIKVVGVVAGTVGGIGAILAYAPPHQSTGVPVANPSPMETSAVPTPSQSASETPLPAASETPTPTTPTSAKPTRIAHPSPKKSITEPKAPINGTFTGVAAKTDYGPVQVQIDVVNGKIVAARALQLPSGTPKDKELNALAVPYLIQETVKESSSNIQGVGGATYTSQGWYDSLVSALARAGM